MLRGSVEGEQRWLEITSILTYAAAVCQALVSNVLQVMFNWFLFVYMDNILI